MVLLWVGNFLNQWISSNKPYIEGPTDCRQFHLHSCCVMQGIKGALSEHWRVHRCCSKWTADQVATDIQALTMVHCSFVSLVSKRRGRFCSLNRSSVMKSASKKWAVDSLRVERKIVHYWVTHVR
jgi:hypothetical protein